jgi:hypothetical protein
MRGSTSGPPCKPTRCELWRRYTQGMISITSRLSHICISIVFVTVYVYGPIIHNVWNTHSTSYSNIALIDLALKPPVRVYLRVNRVSFLANGHRSFKLVPRAHGFEMYENDGLGAKIWTVSALFAAVFRSIAVGASVLDNHTSKPPRETIQIDEFSREPCRTVDISMRHVKIQLGKLEMKSCGTHTYI